MEKIQAVPFTLKLRDVTLCSWFTVYTRVQVDLHISRPSSWRPEMSKIRHPCISRPGKVRYMVALGYSSAYMFASGEQCNRNGLECSGQQAQRCGRGTVDVNRSWHRRLCHISRPFTALDGRRSAVGQETHTAAVYVDKSAAYCCPTCPTYELTHSLSGL